MIPRCQRLVPSIQRTLLSRQYKIMTPSIAPSSSEPSTTPLREAVDTMATNLSRAIIATSHDFRSDTVTGLIPEYLA
jgi:hypothetical protein